MVDFKTRKRGGQPGNLNAARYGYYYHALSPEDRKLYLQARKCQTLDYEITTVRNLIPQIAADAKQVHLLPRILNALDRLVRTNETLKPRRLRRKATTLPTQDRLIH